MDEHRLLRYFRFDHLPEHLQEVSRPFHDLAHRIWNDPDLRHDEAERTTALRKLLESKDAAVRAALPN
ncbi:MAG TPA: hypothetical protein VF192_01375 [Longimicrobiales bacterium]